MTQIFAHTPTITGGPYVKFLQAFREDGGDIRIVVRNEEGVSNEITISPHDATALVFALHSAIVSEEPS